MIETDALFQYGKTALRLACFYWLLYRLGLFFWRLLHGRISLRDLHKRW